MTNLSTNQEQAVILLHQSIPIKSIAEQLCITRQTIWNWKKTPEFKEALLSLRRESHDALYDGFFALQDSALKTLEQGLQSDDESIAFRCAKLILEHIEKAAALIPPEKKEGSCDSMEDWIQQMEAQEEMTEEEEDAILQNEDTGLVLTPSQCAEFTEYLKDATPSTYSGEC